MSRWLEGLACRLCRGESGQAMAEYAIVVAAVTSILVVGGFSFLPEFIKALQRYYDAYYIMINLPIP